MKRGARHVLLYWTLRLSEHHLGHDGSGMTNHHSLTHGSAKYGQSESWGSTGGSGTTVNGPGNMGMRLLNLYYPYFILNTWTIKELLKFEGTNCQLVDGL